MPAVKMAAQGLLLAGHAKLETASHPHSNRRRLQPASKGSAQLSYRAAAARPCSPVQSPQASQAAAAAAHSCPAAQARSAGTPRMSPSAAALLPASDCLPIGQSRGGRRRPTAGEWAGRQAPRSGAEQGRAGQDSGRSAAASSRCVAVFAVPSLLSTLARRPTQCVSSVGCTRHLERRICLTLNPAQHMLTEPPRQSSTCTGSEAAAVGAARETGPLVLFHYSAKRWIAVGCKLTAADALKRGQCVGW